MKYVAALYLASFRSYLNKPVLRKCMGFVCFRFLQRFETLFADISIFVKNY